MSREADEKVGYHRTSVTTKHYGDERGSVVEVEHIGPEAIDLGAASVRPLHDVVLVRRTEPEKITASGLHIPVNAQHESTIGTVVAVGPGRQLEDGTRVPPFVAVGNQVLLARWLNRDEVEVDGQRCVVVRESDIYAVLDDEAPVKQIVASGDAKPGGWIAQELDNNVAAHKASGAVVEPCGFCGKGTTMVSYVIGADTPQGQAHAGPAELLGYRVPACCARDACIDRMNSDAYLPPEPTP